MGGLVSDYQTHARGLAEAPDVAWLAPIRAKLAEIKGEEQP